MSDRIARSGVEAARRKFTPEFMNRLDKVVVFQPLGEPELQRILDLEIDLVQERIHQTSAARRFHLNVSDDAKRHLLNEGIDARYGARHLKRAIERLLVHPLSNLIATDQVRGGDRLRVDFDEDNTCLSFHLDAQSTERQAAAQATPVVISEMANPLVMGMFTNAPRQKESRAGRR